MLAEVVTDAAGLGQVEVPLDEISLVGEDRRDRLWVRPKQEGLQEYAASRRLPADGSALEIKLLVRAGGTVRGRLLDAEGEPVAGSVRAVLARAGRWLGFGSGGKSDSTGWFAIHLNQGGRYEIVAQGGDSGTAVLRDHPLDLRDLSEPLILRLRGPGVLRGRVRDPDGNPSAGLEILVLVAELDDEAGSFVLPQPRGSEVELEGCGQTWRTGQTGADGSFEFLGLRDDRYVVRARTSNASGYPLLLTPGGVASDGSALDLRLSRPHLAVRIQDANGEPWTGEIRARVRHRDRGTGAADDWPETLTLLVTPILDDLDLPADGVFLSGRSVGGAEFIYEVSGDVSDDVSDGRRLVIGLIGAGVPWKPVEARVPVGASRIEVVLTVPGRKPTGEVALTVFGPDGTALVRKLEIRFQDEVTGFPLLGRNSFYRSPWPQVFELPAGDYRLVVEGDASIDSHHGTLMSPRECGRFETLVRIRSGQRVEIQANLPQGARVKVHLRGAVLEKDREAIRLEYPDSSVSIDYWSRRAELELRGEGDWPQPVYFTDDEMFAGTSAAGTHRTPWLALGSTDTSGILSAGDYVLRASMPGGRVVTRSLTLVDGQTTEVTLSFE